MKIDSLKMNSTDQVLQLREVKQEDCELLWKWANDPIVRGASFSSQEITWEDHIKWFNNKINSSSCKHFIAVNKLNQPIGQIRFEINQQLIAIVSLSLDSQYRGRNYSKLMLQMAMDKLLQNNQINYIQALIKPNNVASIRLFQSVGFEMIDSKPSKLSFRYIYENH